VGSPPQPASCRQIEEFDRHAYCPPIAQKLRDWHAFGRRHEFTFLPGGGHRRDRFSSTKTGAVEIVVIISGGTGKGKLIGERASGDGRRVLFVLNVPGFWDRGQGPPRPRRRHALAAWAGDGAKTLRTKPAPEDK